MCYLSVPLIFFLSSVFAGTNTYVNMNMINMLVNTKYFSDFQSLPFIFNGRSFLTNKAKINKAYNQSV